MKNKFHACASCVHFRAQRIGAKMKYECARLRYETNPKYQFNCWTPKGSVKKLMEKRGM
ncbi:hypothetical protein K6959_09565 [Bacillus aquiflavi]|uniref:hypothetical protein n=1 Tax=Bacillus aquiflavi TaxID=2672567 RepID=UPI001CA98D98|nr:hypothetical protein [Bacillus aquiflavi]UAC47016.1 hypothetical protein K6959_09565 [Bacillus aquiflavi]